MNRTRHPPPVRTVWPQTRLAGGWRVDLPATEPAEEFPQSMTAVVTVNATMSRSVGKGLTAVVTTSATMTRQVGKILSATVVVQATLAAPRVVAKTLTATVSVVASLVADFVPGGAAAVAKLRTLLGLGQ